MAARSPLQRELERQARADVELAMRVALLLTAGSSQVEVGRALGLSAHEVKDVVERLRKIAPAIERDCDLDF